MSVVEFDELSGSRGVGKAREDGGAHAGRGFAHGSIKREGMAEPWDLGGQLHLRTVFLILAARLILHDGWLSD